MPPARKPGVFLNTMNQETKILHRLKKKDRKALLHAIEEHAENMVILAFTILNDSEDANIVVRDLLCTLLERGFPGLCLPLHTYFYEQVRQACREVPSKTSD